MAITTDNGFFKKRKKSTLFKEDSTNFKLEEPSSHIVV
jgi:hypothetical protein